MAVTVYEPSFYHPQVLCAAVPIDSTSASAQTVVQLAPPSSTTAPGYTGAVLDFVVLAVRVRNTSANPLGGAITFNLGWNASAATNATNLLSASTALQSLAAGASYVFSMVGAAQTTGTPGQYLNCKFSAGTSSTGIQVDVIGYFTPVA